MWNKPGKPLPPRVYREVPVEVGFRMRKEVGKDACPVCQFYSQRGDRIQNPWLRSTSILQYSSCRAQSEQTNSAFFKRRPEHTGHSFSLQTHLRPWFSADRGFSRTYPELTTAVLLHRSIPVRLGGPDKHESARPSLGKLNQLPMLMK